MTRTAQLRVYDSARRLPAAFEELVSLWAYRDLVVQLVRRDLVARYKRSVLGVLWTLLTPLGTMVILVVVFSHAFAVGRTYPAYVLAGLLGGLGAVPDPARAPRGSPDRTRRRSRRRIRRTRLSSPVPPPA